MLINKIIESMAAYRDLSIEHWMKYELFTWVWWLELLFTVVPLIFWWKVVDRRRILEIAVFGLIINVQATFLDTIGSEYVLWSYPIRLLPVSTKLLPVDFDFLPVCFMLVYQYFKGWKPFLIGSAVAAAVLAFILEPVAVLINEYVLLGWKYVYSFPIYILSAIVAKVITELVANKGTNEI